MSLTTVILLLQLTLSVLTLVQAHPELDSSVRDNVLALTQQAISQANAALQTGAQNQCPASPPMPTTITCASAWQKIMSNRGCQTAWSCVTYSSSNSTGTINGPPPIITSIQGPTNITTWATSTWKIIASSNNPPLTYNATFGDENTGVSGLLGNADSQSYTSSNMFTHTYKNVGLYTIVMYVKDAVGGSNKAAISISVQRPTPPYATSTGATTTQTPKTCTYNGQTYSEGGTYTSTAISSDANTCRDGGGATYGKCTITTVYTCRNGQWVVTSTTTS